MEKEKIKFVMDKIIKCSICKERIWMTISESIIPTTEWICLECSGAELEDFEDFEDVDDFEIKTYEA
jgi:hypothetical protein